MFASALTATAQVPEEDRMATCEARSLDDLADEIAELSAHIDAATYRPLKAIAEFDRREGWCGETMDYELAVSGLLDADAEGPPALERSLPLSISILAPVSLRVFG